MEELFDPGYYAEEIAAARLWLEENALALSIATLGQALVLGLAFLAARLAAPRLRVLLARPAHGRFEPQIVRLTQALQPLALPIMWLLGLWLAVLLASTVDLPFTLMKTVVSLLTAWVVIRFTASLVRDPLWSRFVAIVVWVIAALSILGLLAPTMATLDGIAINLGDLRVSALTVVKAVLSLALLLWIATFSGRVLERRITAATNLTPSVQVLLIKLLKIVLTVIALVVALRTVGIDLTAFAVLTGAIGVGIGFGLQKMVSNFVSGITILLDKSIKPGDVLVVGDTYGRVHSLGARYVSLITRDGTEYLIPNEDLVTQQVVNWSYSSDQVRLKVSIGISYSADVRQAIALCLESAGQVPRVLKQPAPVCLLKGFGDSSVDLELRFWIQDPMNGTANVKSEVLLHIWDRFHEHGIEIPFPQRDLTIKTPVEVRVKGAET
ncbi:mechanosensitive ion channel family protein [Dongia deserti]|uniref:mechanosensitive ion channel family protein n=1 Tax=Dongia deserti TaxID=2268030 RepID=UPI000E65164C|nr:mechanosensitive ion channel domain-containing protein [Dongia deserti]